MKEINLHTEGHGWRGGGGIITFLLNKAGYNPVCNNDKQSNIIVRSKFHNHEPYWNKNSKKYIYFSGESYPPQKSQFESDSIYICTFIKKNLNNLHIPYVLNSPYLYKDRIHTNGNRPYLLAYCHKNRVKEREDFFNTFVEKSSDKLCHALSGVYGGKYPNTKQKQVPGGWHSRSLVDTYKNYKFVMAMENEIVDGYVTEKILNAFVAGAIPIYWGTDKVNDYFNKDAFINVSDFKSFDECVNYCINLSEKEITKMQNQKIYTDNELINIRNPDYTKNKNNTNTTLNTYLKKLKKFINN